MKFNFSQSRIKTAAVLSLVIILAMGTQIMAQTVLRSETAELSKEELLKEIKEAKLYCPGEKIKGKIKNQFELVTLKDVQLVKDLATNLMWQAAEYEEMVDWRELCLAAMCLLGSAPPMVGNRLAPGWRSAMWTVYGYALWMESPLMRYMLNCLVIRPLNGRCLH